MSEVLRIALVAEGPTDRVVIESAVQAILGEQPFILRQIQPEQSQAFGPIGTGWIGVYRWSKQAVQRAGTRFADDPLFREYQILIIHLDADVADKSYEDGGITTNSNDLPCASPCPPPANTTNQLRSVILRWLSETSIPPKVVLCTPSKSTEAWVLAAIFPQDQALSTLECHPDPESRLSVQPAGVRIRKKQREYAGLRNRLVDAWPKLTAALSEAERFDAEFSAAANAA